MAEASTKKNRTRYMDVASIVVREWAQQNGHPQIGDRGRLSTTVVKEFNDAHKAEKLRYSGPGGQLPEGWVSTGATSNKDATKAPATKDTTKAAPSEKVTTKVPKASTKAAVREQVTSSGNVPASFADIMELFSKQANTPGTVTIMTAALPVPA